MEYIVTKEESFDDEVFRESQEYIAKRTKDRDDDYSYQPSNAILGGIERSLNRKLED